MPKHTDGADMKRRHLLSSAAVALGGVFAGCNTGGRNGNANGSGNESAETSESTTTGGAPTTTAGATTAGPTGTTTKTGTETGTGTRGTETIGPETLTEPGKGGGPQTETARVPTTGTTTATETRRGTTAATTTGESTPGAPSETSDTRTPVPIPDPPNGGDSPGEATVSFENGGSRVVVAGTITGQDSCRKAVLESVESNDGTLVVTVGTERDAGTDTMCAQVLTGVEYRFALTPDTPPDSVTVVHIVADGRRTVTTAERG